MENHTKGPWVFLDECGSVPHGSCTPLAGVHKLSQDILNEEEIFIGRDVLSVCKHALEKACDDCHEEGPCAGMIRVTQEDALLIAASPELHAAVIAMEWSGNGEACPICRSIKSNGHKPNCIVGISLLRARGENNEI